MDAHLLQLRAKSYSTGLVYDRAFRMCGEALMHRPDAGIGPVIAAFNQAARQYGAALVKLLDYLATLEPTRAIEDEINRTTKILGLLNNEIEIVNDRYEQLS
jgi:hypothetical protein